MTQKLGIGAQFGGKYFCHDVRVIRLPRHGASCQWALASVAALIARSKAKLLVTGFSWNSLKPTLDDFYRWIQIQQKARNRID